MYYTIRSFSNPKKSIEIDTEDKSEILDLVNSIDYSKKFELILVKNGNSINIINEANEYVIYFTKGDSIDFPSLSYPKNKKGLVLEIFKEFIKEEKSNKTEKRFIDFKNKKKALETKRFNEWKIGYEEKRRKERFNLLKPAFITIFLLLFIFYVGHLFFTENYKFIGQKTAIINGFVFQSGKTHLGRGVYRQKIKYNYTFEGKHFESSKILFKNLGYKKKGDSIQLKISVSNPERNKVLGFYK